MGVHDELEVLSGRLKSARYDQERLRGRLMDAVRRAYDGGMDIENIAAHAQLSIEQVKDHVQPPD